MAPEITSVCGCFDISTKTESLWRSQEAEEMLSAQGVKFPCSDDVGTDPEGLFKIWPGGSGAARVSLWYPHLPLHFFLNKGDLP